jgi:two-component system, OmpR family, response regulator
MAERVLIIDDDARLAAMVSDYLVAAGFAVDRRFTGRDGLAAVDRATFDAVILDVMLPDADGFEICRDIRARSQTPILMLTARGEETDRIVGLEIGADDYVTKPFNTRELIARIRALLRRARASGGRARQSPLRFAGWVIHPTERKLINPQGALVTTTSAEFDLLLAFCTHPGEVLSREQLLDLTHGGIAGPVERSVDVHVSRIRQKIEPDPGEPSFIKTIRLGGYIFTPEVADA